jgi:predicted O-methyltransferase YrrM
MMASRSIGIEENVGRYVEAHSRPEPEQRRKLRAETAALGDIARMEIGADQGDFMALLVRMLGGRRVLEIGTFTGYSALAMSEGLAPGGKIVTCDVSEEWTRIARKHWNAAGVGDRIELRLGPALATLDDLLAKGGAGSFDLAFIDADKERYAEYWDRCVELVRKGGAILVDNVLWSGRVADPADQTPDTRAIRAVNGKIRDDVRVAMAMIGAFDGLTVAVVL